MSTYFSTLRNEERLRFSSEITTERSLFTFLQLKKLNTTL
ncbi:hypothetical protein QF004_001375 [Chryseobacterium sp. MDT2-18]|nr:hypothetical protein [Chryseobacterium sp. MDT2-18]